MSESHLAPDWGSIFPPSSVQACVCESLCLGCAEGDKGSFLIVTRTHVSLRIWLSCWFFPLHSVLPLYDSLFSCHCIFSQMLRIWPLWIFYSYQSFQTDVQWLLIYLLFFISDHILEVLLLLFPLGCVFRNNRLLQCVCVNHTVMWKGSDRNALWVCNKLLMLWGQKPVCTVALWVFAPLWRQNTSPLNVNHYILGWRLCLG